MRIVYVISYYKPAYGYGGPVRSTSLLCEALARLGAKVTVLTTDANGAERLDVPLGQPVDVDGVEVYYYHVLEWPVRSFFHAPDLARNCGSQIQQADIVVLDTLFTHAMGPCVAACRHHSVPYIVALRGQLLPWALRHRRLKKWLYWHGVGYSYLNGAAALHCTDLIEAEAAAKLRLTVPAFVVPNGLEMSRWAQLPTPGHLKQRLGIPAASSVVLFLGRLHQVKRPDVALGAFATQGRADIHLVYVGPDEENLIADLCRMARQQNCAERVHFTGLLTGTELLEALVDADLLIMPSAMESFGMAAVEALSAGVPILTSENIPVGRWASQAKVGAIASGSALSFSQALRDLFAKPDELAYMGERARRLAREHFDVESVARKMLEQFQAIATTGAPVSDAFR